MNIPIGLLATARGMLPAATLDNMVNRDMFKALSQSGYFGHGIPFSIAAVALLFPCGILMSLAWFRKPSVESMFSRTGALLWSVLFTILSGFLCRYVFLTLRQGAIFCYLTCGRIETDIRPSGDGMVYEVFSPPYFWVNFLGLYLCVALVIAYSLYCLRRFAFLSASRE